MWARSSSSRRDHGSTREHLPYTALVKRVSDSELQGEAARLVRIARTLAERLGPALGQALVIENRPGAAGNIGTVSVLKAPADGSTPIKFNLPAKR